MFRRISITFLFYSFLILTFIIPTASANAGFVDVEKSNSHYEAIKFLTDYNIISGYTLKDGTREYRPSHDISRTHTAVMFTKALELEIPINVEAILNNYNDIDISHPYAIQIAATYEAGIFRGSQGNFNEGPLTREQMATVIVKTYNLKDTGRNIDINLENVSPSHQDAVKILAQHGYTNQLNDFRPKENVTRGQIATFLYQTMFVEETDPEDEEPIEELPSDPIGEVRPVEPPAKPEPEVQGPEVENHRR